MFCDSEISDDELIRIGAKAARRPTSQKSRIHGWSIRRHSLDEVLRLEIAMHDVVIVQVLYAFEDVTNNLGGISLRKLAATRDLLKQFSA